MGNGNSQIGVQLALAFWRDGDDPGFKPEASWSLSLNARHPDDALRMPQLELTDKPTTRWTVVTW
jgi:hypothetical protein